MKFCSFKFFCSVFLVPSVYGYSVKILYFRLQIPAVYIFLIYVTKFAEKICIFLSLCVFYLYKDWLTFEQCLNFEKIICIMENFVDTSK